MNFFVLMVPFWYIPELFGQKIQISAVSITVDNVFNFNSLFRQRRHSTNKLHHHAPMHWVKPTLMLNLDPHNVHDLILAHGAFPEHSQFRLHLCFFLGWCCCAGGIATALMMHVGGCRHSVVVILVILQFWENLQNPGQNDLALTSNLGQFCGSQGSELLNYWPATACTVSFQQPKHPISSTVYLS